MFLSDDKKAFETKIDTPSACVEALGTIRLDVDDFVSCLARHPMGKLLWLSGAPMLFATWLQHSAGERHPKGHRRLLSLPNLSWFLLLQKDVEILWTLGFIHFIQFTSIFMISCLFSTSSLGQTARFPPRLMDLK